jgi:Matrixin
MTGSRKTAAPSRTKKATVRRLRPLLEGLEGRLLLYSAIGQWTYSSRITYSFMPDGTSVGGVSSVLFQTMKAIAPTATWENQIEQAATPWEANANLNLALVSDNGEPVGSPGDQQDDPNVGDIRIGAVPLPSGVLAETFLPPSSNGGTIAGDIVFNSTVQWQIGTGIDLETVAAHEFGHALGLGESTVQNAVMYGTYDGIKTALASDDVSGIQSLYGAPKYDQFNSGSSHNGTFLTATNITSDIGSNGQIAIANLDSTTSGQSEWYTVTVPSSNSGNMAVTVQSINLSSFAPAMYIYNSSLGLVTSAMTPTSYGSELSVSVPVSAGQKYYIKVMEGGSYGQMGTYGLLLNFGNQSQPQIPPPNTIVPQQPNGSGGSVPNAVWGAIGNLAGWAMAFDASSSGGGTTNGGTTLPSGPAANSNAISDASIVASPAAAVPAVTVSTGTSGTSGSQPTVSATASVATAPPSGLVVQALDPALFGSNADNP